MFPVQTQLTGRPDTGTLLFQSAQTGIIDLLLYEQAFCLLWFFGESPRLVGMGTQERQITGLRRPFCTVNVGDPIAVEVSTLSHFGLVFFSSDSDSADADSDSKKSS